MTSSDNNMPGEVERELTRPIIGIEHRTGDEAHAIMCDRIRSAFKSGRITALTQQESRKP